MKTLTSLLSLFILANCTHAQGVQWNQLGQDIYGEASLDRFGWQVTMNGNGQVIAAGSILNDGNGNASGHVRVFSYNGNTWVQMGQDLDGEFAEDRFGYSLSINHGGNVIAIGGYFNSENGFRTGHVKVYEWNGLSWAQRGVDLDGITPNDRFGEAVCMDSTGNTVVIAGSLTPTDSTFRGRIRAYDWNGTQWVQRGQDILGDDPGDRLGSNLSLDAIGNTLIAGASNSSTFGASAGKAQVFSWNGTSWVQKGQTISTQIPNDFFGDDVSINASGNVIAIASQNSNNSVGQLAGETWVYEWAGTSWVQKGASILGEAPFYTEGGALSLNANGTRIAIGALNNDDNGTDAGQIRVFDWDGNNWIQFGQDINGVAANNWFGISSRLNATGNYLVGGASTNSANGQWAGQVRVFSICSQNFASVNPTGPVSICQGDSVVLTASGGNQIQWLSGTSSPINTIFNSGNYAAVVSDSLGCTDTSNAVVVTVNPNPSVTINPVGNASFCLGDSLQISASGAQNYLWSNGMTTPSIWAFTNGAFFAVGTDSSGCSDTSGVLNITTFNSPSITSQPMNLQEQVGNTALFSIASQDMGDLFVWEIDSGLGFQTLINGGQFSGALSNQLSISNVNLQNNGQLFRAVVSNSNCSDTSQVALLSVIPNTGFNTQHAKTYSFYPNPTNQFLIINRPLSAKESIEISDVYGKLVIQGELKESKSKIDLYPLNPGVYWINIGGEINRIVKF